MGLGRLPLLMGMGMVGSGSSVLRAMSCHPEFKCNLEIARKGEGERSILKAAGSPAILQG